MYQGLGTNREIYGLYEGPTDRLESGEVSKSKDFTQSLSDGKKKASEGKQFKS